MITYEQIEKVNEGLTGIDVKGKNYVMVPQRVKAFRQLFPDGFIRTELLSLQDGVCVMQSKAGYYTEDGKEIVLGTGLAYEKEANGYINKTSFIENCETSSVGRCLGFIGLGVDGGGICSAEELANAINNQNKKNDAKFENTHDKNVVNKVPDVDKTMSGAFASGMNEFMERFGYTNSQEALAKFNEWRAALRKGGVIKQGDKMQTPEEVNETFEAIYANYKPSGEVA